MDHQRSPKLKQHRHKDGTSPLIWSGAILCAIIAGAVIIVGIVLFVGYLTIKPKIPQILVSKAQLNTIDFDQSSLLTLQVTVVIKAENDNSRAHVNFYNTNLALSLGGGPKIAYLVAGPFNLGPNKSMELSYVPQSGAIPLNPEEADAVNLSIRRGVMNFYLVGSTRSRWQFGFINSFKFSLHLECMMQLPIDGTVAYPPHCRSKMT